MRHPWSVQSWNPPTPAQRGAFPHISLVTFFHLWLPCPLSPSCQGVAFPCCSCWPHTFADLAVLLQDVAPGAGALVAALGVLADEVAGLWGLVALVQICTPGTQNASGRAPLRPLHLPAHPGAPARQAIPGLVAQG